METEKKIVGRCPLCDGSVARTCKGYHCEHNIGDNPSCVFSINGIISDCKMGDGEVAELPEKRRVLLDGFATKEGKTFPIVLELVDDGAVNTRPVIGKYSHCGEDIHVGGRVSNCFNYGNQEKPCPFAIWRNIGGRQITLVEATGVCEGGITVSELEMYRDNGSTYRRRLGLAPDKLQIMKV